MRVLLGVGNVLWCYLHRHGDYIAVLLFSKCVTFHNKNVFKN